MDLHGRTILVTRAPEDALPWAQAFEQHGARSVVFPCLHAEPIDDASTRETLASAIAVASWVVFTSARAVSAANALGVRSLPKRAKVAAVGERTADAARACFSRCHLVGSGTGATLGRSLADAIVASSDPSAHVVLPIAAGGRSDVEEALSAHSIPWDRVPVYRTVPAPVQVPRQDLASLGIDTIVLASPSAVEGLVHRAVVPAGARVVTIGPTTSRAARSAGLSVAAEAATPNLDAIMEVIA